MTKAALDNMVKGLAQELMPDGIRINAISPGLIRTNFAGAILENPNVNPASIGTPDQIASVAATICAKKDGGFMNGEIYLVHGGFAKM